MLKNIIAIIGLITLFIIGCDLKKPELYVLQATNDNIDNNFNLILHINMDMISDIQADTTINYLLISRCLLLNKDYQFLLGIIADHNRDFLNQIVYINKEGNVIYKTNWVKSQSHWNKGFFKWDSNYYYGNSDDNCYQIFMDSMTVVDNPISYKKISKSFNMFDNILMKSTIGDSYLPTFRQNGDTVLTADFDRGVIYRQDAKDYSLLDTIRFILPEKRHFSVGFPLIDIIGTDILLWDRANGFWQQSINGDTLILYNLEAFESYLPSVNAKRGPELGFNYQYMDGRLYIFLSTDSGLFVFEYIG